MSPSGQRLSRQIDRDPAEGLLLKRELVAEAPGHGVQTAHALGGDLRADAIATQNGDGRLHQSIVLMAAFIGGNALPAAAAGKPSSSTPFSRQNLAKGSMGKLTLTPVGSRRVALARSMLTSLPGLLISQPLVVSSTTMGSSPFISELLRKMSAISVLMTARMPKSSSAHGACSREEPQPKLRSGHQHLATGGRRLIQDEVGLGSPVRARNASREKQLLPKPDPGGRGEKARRDDLVGVDVAGGQYHRARLDGGDLFHYSSSRGSVTRPRMALAAAVSGLASKVRAPAP